MENEEAPSSPNIRIFFVNLTRNLHFFCHLNEMLTTTGLQVIGKRIPKMNEIRFSPCLECSPVTESGLDSRSSYEPGE